MLPSQLGRGALLRAEEGLRVLACESVEALAVKLWVYALLRAAARAGALPQRARAMCGARARGVASLRQLFSEFVLQGCVCRRARRALPKSWLSGSRRVARPCSRSMRVSGTLRDAEIELCFSGRWLKSRASLAKCRGFSSKRHARVEGSFFTGS